MNRSNNIPCPKELDFYVETEGLLELCTQCMTCVVFPHVHGIRERQLFEVPFREESDFLEHTGESAARYGTARETKIQIWSWVRSDWIR